eukprot:3180589-Amphidinium_carterae.1
MLRRSAKSGRRRNSARAVCSNPAASPLSEGSRRAPGWFQPPGGFHDPGPGVMHPCIAQMTHSHSKPHLIH